MTSLSVGILLQVYDNIIQPRRVELRKCRTLDGEIYGILNFVLTPFYVSFINVFIVNKKLETL